MKKFGITFLAIILALNIGWFTATSDAAVSDAEQMFSELRDAGIFSGYEDGSSRLDEPMTREQFAVILTKLFHLRQGVGIVFKDIAADRWSAPYINAATGAQLMVGVGDGEFAPTKTVSYEEMATVMVKAYGLTAADELPIPGKVSNWAKGFIVRALTEGIIKSQGDYTRPAPRSALVEVAYHAYTPIYATDAIVNGERSVTVKFSDGNQQVVALEQPLAANQINIVHIRYLDHPFFLQLIWNGDGSNEPGKPTDPGDGSEPDPDLPAEPGGDGSTAEQPAPDSEQFVWESLQVLSNSLLKLKLSYPVSSLSGVVMMIHDAWGSELLITNTMLSADGSEIWVYTAEQEAGAQYRFALNRESKPFTALPIDQTKPQVAAVLVNPNATLSVLFDEPIDLQTAVDIANYRVSGAQVLRAVLSDDMRKVTLTTSRLQTGVVYNLSVQNVNDLSGNTMISRNNLVFRGLTDSIKPTVVSVVNNLDSTITIQFSEPLQPETALAQTNYLLSPNLTVAAIRLNKQEDAVILTTSKQTTGTLYTLTILNVTDLSANPVQTVKANFGGYEDKQKPALLKVESLPNEKVQLTFSEKLNKNTAENPGNYTVSPDLTVLQAVLQKDESTVLLTLSKQIKYKIYYLSVQNVADLAGNAMDRKANQIFVGMVDDTGPTVVSALGGLNTVVLLFDEPLDKATAENVSNYSIDGNLGRPLSAVYHEAFMSVTLRTAEQAASKIYNIVINGIRDAAHNPILSATSKAFVGGGARSLILQEIRPIDINTIELQFNRELSDQEIASLSVAITKRNGVNWSPAQASQISYAVQDRKMVRVRFRTVVQQNPTIFQQGYVYEAVVTGAAALKITGDANVKSFAGTYVQSEPPTVVAVQPQQNAELVVHFSEPVKNASYTYFSVADADGTTIPVVGDQLNDPEKPVTSIKLYLGAALYSGKVYQLRVLPGITDVSGLKNAIVPVSDALGSANSAFLFAGIDSANELPRIETVVAGDRRNFTIQFSESMANAAQGIYTLINETDQTAVPIVNGINAYYEASTDRTALHVHMYSDQSTVLKGGKIYRLEYTPALSSITDLQSTVLTLANGTGQWRFAGLDAENEPPHIISAMASGTLLTLEFNEQIFANTANIEQWFDIALDGQAIQPITGTRQGKQVVLTVPPFAIGRTGEIRLTAAGAAAIRDFNNQAPSTQIAFRFVTQ